MNGRELSHQIVLLHPGVRILFMSGYGEEVIAHQGMLEEGVQFMQKPFTVSELVAKVGGALGAGRSGSSA
jgi:FixJ family two-component response regulator